ncbi:unnamed protein product [Cylindrotheca closterium]|uniref:Septum formation protein Maf n=1 Tax=Cylindrotheca closterium TaxID=2856 RepID=A0AAD2FJM3_9STRA|nr:unnamed protein product [Cylindrotheca closterium]
MTSSTELKALSAESSPLLISLRDKLCADNNAIKEGKKACLVLASQSPRRREILDMMGLAGSYSKKLAEAKAHSLAAEHAGKERNTNIPVFYLGSDTVVDIDDKILEKPKNEEEAKQMLLKLSGQEHQVHTGVALYRLSSSCEISLLSSFTESAHITFCNLSDADIDAYIASGEPMDKAGSYGIQGIGGQMVQSIAGDFYTVMGLPMHQTSKHLARALMDE